MLVDEDEDDDDTAADEDVFEELLVTVLDGVELDDVELVATTLEDRELEVCAVTLAVEDVGVLVLED